MAPPAVGSVDSPSDGYERRQRTEEWKPCVATTYALVRCFDSVAIAQLTARMALTEPFHRFPFVNAPTHPARFPNPVDLLLAHLWRFCSRGLRWWG